MKSRDGTVKNVGGTRILYVMAAEAEYGAHLRARFEPLICHVGPVEAAANVARSLASSPEIDLVVSLGSAGSQKLEQAQIYQVDRVSYRDMDATALGFARGETPFLNISPQLPLPHTVPDIPAATLATGASIVSGDSYAAVDADMVDMETFAVLRACMHAGKPLIGLRGISDGAHPVAELSDWTRYLEVIDERLGTAVDRMEDWVERGGLKGG